MSVQSKVEPLPRLDCFCDTLLELIFYRLPLLDILVHIPQVNARWARLQKRILAKLRSLILRFGPNPSSLYLFNKFRIPHGNILKDPVTGRYLHPEPNDLNMVYYKKCKNTTLDSVVSLMPMVSVVELSIHKDSLKSLDSVVNWLKHWRSSLMFLKIYAQFEEPSANGDKGKAAAPADPVQLDITPLITAINNLTILTHLTLYIENHIDLTRINFTFLSRLDEFYFYSLNTDLTVLFNALKQHADPKGDNLQKIAIGNSGSSWADYINEFSDSSYISERFSDLPNVFQYGDGSLKNIDSDSKLMETYIYHFPRLNKFKQWIKVRKLDWLTKTLSPLNHLEFLRILFYSKSALQRSEALTAEQISPLPAVKQISIIAWPSNHSELTSRHWAHIFPNVQCIVLQVASLTSSRTFCKLCSLPFNVSQERAKLCIKKMIGTFKGMPSLRHIYVYINNNTKSVLNITVERSGDRVEFKGI